MRYPSYPVFVNVEFLDQFIHSSFDDVAVRDEEARGTWLVWVCGEVAWTDSDKNTGRASLARLGA